MRLIRKTDTQWKIPRTDAVVTRRSTFSGPLRPTALVLAVSFLSLMGCDRGTISPPDSGAHADGGQAAEEAACTNLFAIDVEGGCASGTETACLAYLLTLRNDAPACGTEYGAYVACLTRLPACVSGQQCPEEFGAYDACVNPSANPAEDAACENLWTIDFEGGCSSGIDEAACVVNLITLRDDAPACRTEYGAFVECLTDQSSCESGQQCPDEFAAYDACANPNGAEIAACANLWSIDSTGGCASGTGEADCVANLILLRDRGPTCDAEYDEFVACLRSQGECASGQQCPTQYEAYATCAGI